MGGVIDICNMALSRVGAERIVSLDDATTEADECRIHYANARDKVLGEREWSFAITRRELAKSTSSPAFGCPNQFPVPSDCIRVLQCFRDSDCRHPLDTNGGYWYLEDGFIVTDEERVFCRYIKRQEDANKFSPGFVQTVVAYLAHQLAIPLAANRSLSADLFAAYETELMKAASADGLQGRNQNIRFSRLTGVRR